MAPASPWLTLEQERAAALTVDGQLPRFEACPATPAEVAAVLREASGAGVSVLPRGAGSQSALGNRPRSYDLALQLNALTGLVEYRPNDLVAVAQAGTPLAALQAVFAEHGQWLALDPPHAGTVTLGGVLATNASGPHRLRYGTARDLILGMHVAYADGTLARSGARVVKSVAGYDLHKVHIGALGTLGVIVEAALRLHPLPAAQQVVLCSAGTATDLLPAVHDLLRLPLGLGAMEMLNPAAVRRLTSTTGVALPPGYLLLALCEGHPRAVSRQEDEIARAVAGGGLSIEVAAFDAAPKLLEALRDLATSRDEEDSVLKLTVPPGDAIQALADLSTLLEPQVPDAEILAHAGSGVVLAVLRLPDERCAALVEAIRRTAIARRGHLVVQACPPAAKSLLEVWGPAAAPSLIRGLKQALDPQSILNPGRYVEGL